MRRHSVYEAAANVVAGSLISNIVLWEFGLPLVENIELTAVMIAASFARSYVIRRIFANMHDR